MVGDEIELLVYLDGNTFSIYPIPPLIVDSGEILLGVINRYFETGVDVPPTESAALDTTASQDRSYVAYWTGDPPPNPEFASAEGVVVLDGVNSGNFMIRGLGTLAPAVVLRSRPGVSRP